MKTTKIVYNACFGGFGLSEKAVRRYAEIKGFSLFTQEEFSMTHYYTNENMSSDSYFSPSEIARTDPTLVQVVEELGAEANGRFSRLSIAELPVGTKYRIDEYDGNESVMTQEDYAWETA